MSQAPWRSCVSPYVCHGAPRGLVCSAEGTLGPQAASGCTRVHAVRPRLPQPHSSAQLRDGSGDRRYLLAVARGIWVVDMEWVRQSCRLGRWAEEALYEVKGDTHFRGGPRKGRLRAIAGQPPLFDGLLFHLCGSFKGGLSVTQLQALIHTAGGRWELRLANGDALTVEGASSGAQGKRQAGLRVVAVCHKSNLSAARKRARASAHAVTTGDWLLQVGGVIVRSETIGSE